ncbi:MAG: 2OG-Fe dioxygenase family protein [Hydrogenophaga sp.]|uniref:2OG-Fe dioxygenase family protein n=1 Tax=Hydrogenophaga sp. TaxID=1904254 RepID=UPI001D494B39|nr:2OG-Fe dioxygenase family protein [Hydrogenophaga sp.]MBX3610445.1 2OG-Fe dioxygenase family protein [Hydrogenophaga sp.]
MSTSEFSPPYLSPHAMDTALRERGVGLLSGADTAAWIGVPLAALRELEPFWHRLAPDNYLKDGGRYRQRRHSCFVVDGERLTQVPHRAHWQPVEYNALHGGMQRWFEPMEDAMVASAAWQRLLLRLGAAASALRGPQPWFVEAHPFRIDTTDGIGRPTPEGAHRDGVDLVAVFLVGRHAIKGGESRVFDANGPGGQRFTLRDPWSLLLLDDPRVIHESTPIQPDPADGLGWRDTLVVTLRAGGFQGA